MKIKIAKIILKYKYITGENLVCKLNNKLDYNKVESYVETIKEESNAINIMYSDGKIEYIKIKNNYLMKDYIKRNKSIRKIILKTLPNSQIVWSIISGIIVGVILSKLTK